jgi:two-component sensor histidine kinase
MPNIEQTKQLSGSQETGMIAGVANQHIGVEADTPLLMQQSLRYAEDMARLYEEERVRRKALQRVNERLKAEIETRQRAENALREAREELERRVAERTAKLRTANQCLQMEIVQRERNEERISASLREKEALLSEIHHRVKNNLQIISSLLALQCERVTDQPVRLALMDSQSRIRSMALIHEQLYKSRDLSRIDFSEYIGNLSRALLKAHFTEAATVTIHACVDRIFLPVGMALPCSLIINELLTNCLKHAFAGDECGEVRIEFHCDNEGVYRMAVSDNGRGLPADFDWRNTSSLGLKLVMNLAEIQLGGSLDVHTQNGTCFRIEFKDRNLVRGGLE